MADASDIYRRFVEAPLRLKTRTPSPSPPPTPPPFTQQYDAANPSPWGDSPAFSTRSKEVKKLRRRVANIKLSAATSRDLDAELQAAAASDTESSSVDAASSKPTHKTPETEDLGPKTQLRKKKRVTRSVSMTNEDTGMEFVDTPTKASNPPKRFRKYSRDLKGNCNVFAFSLDSAESEERKETKLTETAVKPKRKTSVTVTLPLRRSRRLQHIKAQLPNSPQQETKVSDKTESVVPPSAEGTTENGRVLPFETTRPNAVQEPAESAVDVISTYCDMLLSTSTISGCFFALSWNTLRAAQDSLVSGSTPGDSEPLASVFAICHKIAECEKLAQRSFPSKSPKSPKPPKTDFITRRRSSGKIMLKAKKTKKSVRFRSFDLSCLNLQYVEDEQVAVMVDKILAHYGVIMAKLETIVSHSSTETETPVRSVLRELSRVMASPSELYSSPQSTSDEAKRTYRRAFGGRDSYSQHEIRICGEYFARQFTNLLLPLLRPPQFLQGVFSSLASSTVRFKLRVLFIDSEDFGEDVSGGDVVESRVLLDEDGKPFPAMAPYGHQDLGAAIHWALQESVLYWSLIQPFINLLECEESGDGDLVKEFLDERAAEDLDHMEKYVLARRFMRFHLNKSWQHRLKGDTDAAEVWTSIEKVCTLAKRFHFEDEAHLFPLASIDEFVALLAREEPTLKRMEEELQSFYEQKYGTSSLQPEPCMECHHLITREENSSSIRCTSCARKFHLGCLHLPESFTQYAKHYTCPACFLGRGGY
ncbi:hypothetical protein V7S43_006126 [Phytophthora oleae]|uniref:Zinc finger PHD-type domain-containing protein n=1 Tax=Phytophthora oleae TaxID=2107226 RepID=A0ABD3FRB6_9STRA